MKFRKLVFLLIFLLIVVAWFTKPGLEAFHNYYGMEVQGDTPPLIDLDDKFIYTTVTVDFYKATRLDAGESVKAVSIRKEKYLGLFGRFWKLD